MFAENPLFLSRVILGLLGTQVFVKSENRIPLSSRVLVVSNHRSFMDALVLMSTMGRPVHFACHHYMKKVPLLREIVTQLGAFPLEVPKLRQQHFFQEARKFLGADEWVGVFPEGASPMVQSTKPQQLQPFHRGFAHLALRMPMENLVVLPVAIASQEELDYSSMPLRWFSFFDASEPMFQQDGLHPAIFYKKVEVLIGKPISIQNVYRQAYNGKKAKITVDKLIDETQSEISNLLHQAFS